MPELLKQLNKKVQDNIKEKASDNEDWFRQEIKQSKKEFIDWLNIIER